MNWIIRISVLLNATLLMVAALTVGKSNPTAASGPEVALTSSAATDATVMGTPPPSDDSHGSVVATNAFHWRALEATNYDEFVANLRGVGCPERTIRDILFADAERRYAAASAEQAENLPFWLAGRALAEANRRAQTNCTTAQAAVVADLKRLFGVDWSPEESEIRDVKIQALSRLIVGPVSDEEHERVWRWLLATMQQRQSFRRDREYLLLEVDEAAWHDIVAGRRSQLEQILSRAGYEEFRARSSWMEENFESKVAHMRDLELTPVELRQMCLLKIREIGWLDDLFDVNQNRSDEDAEARKVSFAAALKDVLSPEHFEEFVRVQDNHYREILDVTQDNNLPRHAAQKIYEVQQLARGEYHRLRAAAEAPETAEALVALQVTTEASIRKIMGAEVFNKFAKGNGGWFTNFVKL